MLEILLSAVIGMKPFRPYGTPFRTSSKYVNFSIRVSAPKRSMKYRRFSPVSTPSPSPFLLSHTPCPLARGMGTTVSFAPPSSFSSSTSRDCDRDTELFSEGAEASFGSSDDDDVVWDCRPLSVDDRGVGTAGSVVSYSASLATLTTLSVRCGAVDAADARRVSPVGVVGL